MHLAELDVARMRVRESALFQASDALPLNGDVLEPDVFNQMVLVKAADDRRGKRSPTN